MHLTTRTEYEKEKNILQFTLIFIIISLLWLNKCIAKNYTAFKFENVCILDELVTEVLLPKQYHGFDGL